MLYELDPRKPILYVLPIENILGKLQVVPAGDTRTILFLLKRDFEGSGACTDRANGAGDGCQMWYVNSWAQYNLNNAIIHIPITIAYKLLLVSL